MLSFIWIEMHLFDLKPTYYVVRSLSLCIIQICNAVVFPKIVASSLYTFVSIGLHFGRSLTAIINGRGPGGALRYTRSSNVFCTF